MKMNVDSHALMLPPVNIILIHTFHDSHASRHPVEKQVKWKCPPAPTISNLNEKLGSLSYALTVID